MTSVESAADVSANESPRFESFISRTNIPRALLRFRYLVSSRVRRGELVRVMLIHQSAIGFLDVVVCRCPVDPKTPKPLKIIIKLNYGIQNSNSFDILPDLRS